MTTDIDRALFAKVADDFSEKNNPTAFDVKIDAKHRKAKFTVYSHSWTNTSDGREYHYPSPDPYTIDEYIVKISLFVHNNDAQSLEAWLKSYFIDGTLAVDDESYTQYERETTSEKYKIYKIRPLMEVLIFNSIDVFISLLNSTESKPECRKAFMNSFEHLNLTSAYLHDIDLSNANFKNTILTGAHFKNTLLVDADLSFTQLNNVTGLTAEQLDSCATYEKAKLPKHIWPYWDQQIQSNIRSGLEDLKSYGKKLQKNKKTFDKGMKIDSHAKKMLSELDKTENIKVNQAFKESFVHELNSNKDFNNHRDHGLKVILTNITLCIIGVGVAYLIAGAIHKALTGRFLFFSRTNTQEKIDDVDYHITRMKCRQN